MKSFKNSYHLLKGHLFPPKFKGVPRIVAIEMEHFQSFKEPTRIELNGLTMLFGPNSAGKSAVIDAQSMLSEFWDCERSNSDTLNTMFYRWARDDRETQKKQAKWLKLAVELDINERLDDWEEHDPVISVLLEELRPSVLRKSPKKLIRLEFTMMGEITDNQYQEEYLSPPIVSSVAIKCDGELLVAINLMPELDLRGRRTDIGFIFTNASDIVHHFQYPPEEADKLAQWQQEYALRKIEQTESLHERMNTKCLSEFYWRKKMKDKSEYQKFSHMSYLGTLYSNDDFFKIDEDGGYQYDLLKEGQVRYRMGYFNFGDSPDLEFPTGFVTYSLANTLEEPNPVDKKIQSLLKYFGRLFSMADNVYRPPAITADRMIPKDKGTQFSVDLNNDSFESVSKDPDQFWLKTLACGLHASLLHREVSGEDFIGLSDDLVSLYYAREENHGKRRREMLSHGHGVVTKITADLKSLFSPHHYRLGIMSRLLVDMAKDHPANWTGPRAIVEIGLQDKPDRLIKFEDVGSGVSFVLPILTSLHFLGLLFVQQPELHLHPKIQGRLMDTLLKRAGKKRSIVLETHSEFMILRLLRRIRESKNKKARSKLDISKFAIYYFEPVISGRGKDTETKVTKMELTSDGDFVNRWPNGFFEERLEDLFGEQ